MSNNILPPVPPLESRYPFGPCDFEYLPEHSRLFIKNAYDVISQNKLWDAFREELIARGVDPTTGFMFTANPVYLHIQNLITQTPIGSLHSGGSMAFVMRDIEYIALHGKYAYKKQFYTSLFMKMLKKR